MEQKTYEFLAEIIRDAYYKQIPSDDANYSLRFFAEMIASEVAEFATQSAYENSNQGETTYANDQFISVYKNQDILFDTDGEIYTVLPATPTSLPNNSEVVQVRVIGNKCMDCIPMKNHLSFLQDLIGTPNGMVLYKIENGKIIYRTNNPLFAKPDDITTPVKVNIKLVGAVSGTDLLRSPLNIPKNVESRIMDKILRRLLPTKNQPIDSINDAVPNPS